ncbi:MAG: putative DNA binding domain-containing protein [Gemmatimonadota bacterium]|nr:putative DNA binding domain-containing protein [Gemmatimonadota bacterium]MDE2873431.1 putative DNA binding domain-containing protein [Gemmatimonadota bacterium]
MIYTAREILDRIELGEDSRWEFKQVEFAGTKLKSPKRAVLADEIAAFANSRGGAVLCGVTDDGQVQSLTRGQLAALDNVLAEVGTNSIKPPVPIQTHHMRLPDGGAVLVVDVPKGDAHHRGPGGSFMRVGGTKRRMSTDEQLRLAQRPGQARYLWFDEQIVLGTGYETLSERLWEPLLSVTGAADPRAGLTRLRLLAEDDNRVLRATVAGVLLCAREPQEWLRHAMIVATHYRGEDRASAQLDAQEIGGPLQRQIAEAVHFVVRNMRVAARKTPMRVDMPQYSVKAVFEAVVNAVAHRDYSIASQRIRLAMFRDRLEIDSPGALPNNMTIDGMDAGQATRNEVIASVFGRIPVGEVPGSDHRRYLMERRGDGVSIIKRGTRSLAGVSPRYALVGGSSLFLSIPAARLELTPARSGVTVHSQGTPLMDVEVLALFPNNTWRRATTDEAGRATLNLYTTHLPMTVYAAVLGYCAGIARGWRPDREGLALELSPLSGGGGAIFAEGSGHLPGLDGSMNPVRDSSDRTYLYAANIAIDEGRRQPVPFRLGKPLRLTDSFGTDLSAVIVDVSGKSALVEYRPHSGRGRGAQDRARDGRQTS